MDLKTASGSDMSKKKAPKGAFHGPAGGSFAQKKGWFLAIVYSDVHSLFGDDEDVGITGVYGGSLLGSAATIPKVKCVDTGTIFGSPLGSPDFTMNDDEIVEMSVKKSFALNINLSAIERKSAMTKTQVIRKLFSGINGFGGATTLSKFERIIRSIFTSEANMEKATSLAKDNNIIAVVIKEIPMDTSKEMIIVAVAEFGEIKSIKIQLIGMWQKTVVEFAEFVRVAKAVDNHDIWASRDCFKVLLFTLLVGTTAHDIGTLLDKVVQEMPASFANCLQLARLYAKKNVLIFRPAAFGGKSWVQVVSLASSSVGFSSGSGFGSGAFSHGAFSLGGGFFLLPNVDSSLSAWLASLERSLELLNDWVSGIMHKLSNVNLVPSIPPLSTSGVLAAPAAASFNMALNDTSNNLVVMSPLLFSGSDLGSSSSKVLTSKMGSLESKLLALDASVGVILEKLD
ncbi:hypothetical protein G9A89_010568 [Geosiphon pyriformis]|nr:hypothetical protein G9A89_010568 [Geosiphon pyriformis]